MSENGINCVKAFFFVRKGNFFPFLRKKNLLTKSYKLLILCKLQNPLCALCVFARKNVLAKLVSSFNGRRKERKVLERKLTIHLLPPFPCSARPSLRPRLDCRLHRNLNMRSFPASNNSFPPFTIFLPPLQLQTSKNLKLPHTLPLSLPLIFSIRITL